MSNPSKGKEDESDSDAFSMKSVSCILLSFNSHSPSPCTRDEIVARVRTASAALGAAGSANTLVLAQAILNALVCNLLLSSLNCTAMASRTTHS
jgi:hypothetical protein